MFVEKSKDNGWGLVGGFLCCLEKCSKKNSQIDIYIRFLSICTAAERYRYTNTEIVEQIHLTTLDAKLEGKKKEAQIDMVNKTCHFLQHQNHNNLREL